MPFLIPPTEHSPAYQVNTMKVFPQKDIPEYIEAIAYKNLLFREKADALSKEGKDVEAQAAFAESQRLREQAMQLMQKKKAQAGAAPSPS